MQENDSRKKFCLATSKVLPNFSSVRNQNTYTQAKFSRFSRFLVVTSAIGLNFKFSRGFFGHNQRHRKCRKSKFYDFLNLLCTPGEISRKMQKTKKKVRQNCKSILGFCIFQNATFSSIFTKDIKLGKTSAEVSKW